MLDLTVWGRQHGKKKEALKPGATERGPVYYRRLVNKDVGQGVLEGEGDRGGGDAKGQMLPSFRAPAGRVLGSDHPSRSKKVGGEGCGSR